MSDAVNTARASLQGPTPPGVMVGTLPKDVTTILWRANLECNAKLVGSPDSFDAFEAVQAVRARTMSVSCAQWPTAT